MSDDSLPTCHRDAPRMGGRRKKNYRAKALCQSLAFVALVAGYAVFGERNPSDPSSSVLLEDARHLSTPLSPLSTLSQTSPKASIDAMHARRLDSDNPNLKSCDEIEVADPGWLAAFYSIGVLYMFLALAIVCDEFFVPALEEMASSRHMNLSMDVAGATLMAAGGSAPELFSSLFGTFQESDIGFGTIVGSAVFNVLFVIAMCAIFAKEVLTLTWWPLFRDSFCYAIGLVMLTIFVGVTSPEIIELWEACVLFAMYLVYIVIMWQNKNIYKRLTGKELVDEEEEEEEDETAEEEPIKVIKDGDYVADPESARAVTPPTPTTSNMSESNGADSGGDSNGADVAQDAAAAESPRPELQKAPSNGSLMSAGSLNALVATNMLRGTSSKSNFDFRWQGTFRAGILKLLRDPHSWVETGGVGIVAKIAGDADYVFRKIDANGDGSLDKDELRKLFEALDCRVSDQELDEVFNHLDQDGDGAISFEEFNHWYTQSKELIRSQTRQVFDSIDKDGSGTIDKSELKALLVELDPRVDDADVELAMDSIIKGEPRTEITFEEFESWYEHSVIYERQKKAVEEDMEGAWESLKPPHGDGVFSWVQYIVVLPLVVVMVFTIPDVRRPGWSRWCYVAFLLSIAWIGFFSYLMVSWAEIIGNTIGIPSVIMGLTVLAAGTSVPDLLSSVIVARRGEGDMAVSSSIGSNIFDILVGLPVPWILYTAWPTKPDVIVINADNLLILIIVLLGMLVFVISAVHCQGWKLTKSLAALMMLFYLGFLGLGIGLAIPFETCTNDV